MIGASTALLATALYFVGVAVFKAAADRMEPVLGTRPVHLTVQILTSPVWMAGVTVVIAGLGLQIAALSMIPLSAAQPIFLASLVVLLAIAIGFFRERLTAREWLSLVLVALATLLVALSVTPGAGEGTEVPSTGLLLAVVLPSLILPVIVFSAGDLSPVGRHARPLAGVAYGLAAGVLVGTAELAIEGLSVIYADGVTGTDVLTTPYPYVLIAAAGLGLGQMQIALQRCRLVIVVSIATVVAKTHLLLMATLLYGEPWPGRPLLSLLRVAGFVLGLIAVLSFPRYEDPGWLRNRARPRSAAGVANRQPPSLAAEFGQQFGQQHPASPGWRAR